MRRIETLDGLFLPGDPATSTKGSPVKYWWLNAVQEELVAVVEGLGGTLDPEDNGQLFDWLLASFAIKSGAASQLFRAALAAQFDSSSQVATTEFVKRALGNYSGRSALSATTTLTAAAIGNFIGVAAAAPFTVTLPLISQSPAGSRLEFANQGVALITIARQGADPLNYSDGASIGASFSLYSGDTVILESNGAAWFMCGGSRALGTASGQFAASTAANGYQKLPSGLIIQWGAFSPSSTPGAAVAVTFPITFPQACRALLPSVGLFATTTTQSAWSDSLTTTGFNGRATAGSSYAVNFIAIGN